MIREGNCDFSSNNNIWTRFFVGHLLGYDRLIVILFMGYFAAILKWNFRFKTSKFRLQISEGPAELLYFYIDINFFCEMETQSEGPVNTLTCLPVG